MKWFSLLLVFGSCFCQAQKIEKFFDYNWKPVEDLSKARFYAVIIKADSVWQREDYYVSERRLQMKGYYKDEECKIPHGDFLFFHTNGKLESTGKFVDGKKRGVWISLHDNGMMMDSANYNEHGWVMGTRLSWHSNGYLGDSTVINPDGSGVTVRWWENGNPSAAGRYAPGHLLHGKWQYFHSNGNLASIETYRDDILVDKEYFDERGNKQADTTNRDRPASFPGGSKAWQKYLHKNLYFPDQYKIVNSDEAVVIVRFAVNEDGSISDVSVATSFHPEFDKIAVNVIKRSPKWNPEISHNRKRKSYEKQPVVFSQE